MTVVRWVLFVVLCVAVAGAPLAGFLLMKQLPGAGAWLHSGWVGGVYLSWAALIYFSWAFLPSVYGTWGEWGRFLLLEFVYPAAMWGLGSPEQLAADVATYWSTCVAGAAGLVLSTLGLKGLREEPLGAGIGLVVAVYCVLIPGVAGEVAWWQQVELGGTGWWSPAARVAGLALGMTGVARNLRQMQ